jgi:hypothetical protein
MSRIKVVSIGSLKIPCNLSYPHAKSFVMNFQVKRFLIAKMIWRWMHLKQNWKIWLFIWNVKFWKYFTFSYVYILNRFDRRKSHNMFMLHLHLKFKNMWSMINYMRKQCSHIGCYLQWTSIHRDLNAWPCKFWN